MIFLHILTFGSTDSRRQADVIVVFGAGVSINGRGSTSMWDRVRKSCELYKAGYADKIVMSGGRDKRTALREPDVMLTIALKYGVPKDDIILDQHGDNTLATVRNAKIICDENSWSRVLMVSHDYHLARIKMFSEREKLRSYTVPSFDNVSDKYKVFLVARETVAWGYYYLTSQVGVRHTNRLVSSTQIGQIGVKIILENTISIHLEYKHNEQGCLPPWAACAQIFRT